jgi:hypothetical protein
LTNDETIEVNNLREKRESVKLFYEHVMIFLEHVMHKLPCVTRLTLVVTGLSFLQPGLTTTQFGDMTLIATAVLLGSGFHLSVPSRMWLQEQAVSTVSYFFLDAKLELPELQRRYLAHALTVYNVVWGYLGGSMTRSNIIPDSVNGFMGDVSCLTMCSTPI